MTVFPRAFRGVIICFIGYIDGIDFWQTCQFRPLCLTLQASTFHRIMQNSGHFKGQELRDFPVWFLLFFSQFENFPSFFLKRNHHIPYEILLVTCWREEKHQDAPEFKNSKLDVKDVRNNETYLNPSLILGSPLRCGSLINPFQAALVDFRGVSKSTCITRNNSFEYSWWRHECSPWYFNSGFCLSKLSVK